MKRENIHFAYISAVLALHIIADVLLTLLGWVGVLAFSKVTGISSERKKRGGF